MNHWQVFDQLRLHYEFTGNIMDPQTFIQKHGQNIPSSTVVAGIMLFSDYLDANRNVQKESVK